MELTLRLLLGLLALLVVVAAVGARPHANTSARPPHGARQHHAHHAPHAHHAHLPASARVRHHAHEKRQLCGSGLSDALRSLCHGRGYNTMDSVSDSKNSSGSRGSSGSSGESSGSRLGLASECCHKGCSLKDLDKYCKPLKTPRQIIDSIEADATESASLEAAHHENHIRPPGEESSDTQDENANRMPTVTGARATSELNMTKFEMMVNRTDMISVGTVPLPSQAPVFIHKQRLQSISNSL